MFGRGWNRPPAGAPAGSDCSGFTGSPPRAAARLTDSGQRIGHQRRIVLVHDRSAEAGILQADTKSVPIPEGAPTGRHRSRKYQDGPPLRQAPGESIEPVGWREELVEWGVLVGIPRSLLSHPCAQDEFVDVPGDLPIIPGCAGHDVWADAL